MPDYKLAMDRNPNMELLRAEYENLVMSGSIVRYSMKLLADGTVQVTLIRKI